HPAGLVRGERVAYRLARFERVDGARGGVHVAHDSLGRYEPDPPRPVGERRLYLVAGRHGGAEVVVAIEREPGSRLAHHPDVAGGGGDHGPVAVVEVEVAAAREVGERAAATRDPGREREDGERVERARVEQLKLRSV